MHDANAPLHCVVLFEAYHRDARLWLPILDSHDQCFTFGHSNVLRDVPALARKLVPPTQWLHADGSTNMCALVQGHGALDPACIDEAHVRNAAIACAVPHTRSSSMLEPLLPDDVCDRFRSAFNDLVDNPATCVCVHNYCTLAQLDAAGWERDFRYPHYRDLAKTVKQVWRYLCATHEYDGNQPARDEVRLVYWMYRRVTVAAPPPPPPPPPCHYQNMPCVPPPPRPPHIVVTVDSLSDSDEDDATSNSGSYESLDLEAGVRSNDEDVQFDRFVAQRQSTLPFDAGATVLVVGRDADELQRVSECIAARLSDHSALHHIDAVVSDDERYTIVEHVSDRSAEQSRCTVVRVACRAVVNQTGFDFMLDFVDFLARKTRATVVLEYDDSLRRLMERCPDATCLPWSFDHIVGCPSASQRDTEAAFQMSERARHKYELQCDGTHDEWLACVPRSVQACAAETRLHKIMGELQPADALFFPVAPPAAGTPWRPTPLRNVFATGSCKTKND